MAIPIILDTDIGTDIDDVYALILAIQSPELDVRAVTTVNSDTVLRAKIAKRLLRLMGRDDIPVAAGSRMSLTPGVDRGWLGIEGQGIDLASIDPVRDLAESDGAALIAESACRAAEAGTPLTIVTIGAMTNVAIAMDRYPDHIRRASRILSMASTFEGFGPGNARPEHNVACDPEALRRVLNFGLPLTLIGLNVTSRTEMDLSAVERIEKIGGPLARPVTGMHRVWLSHIGRSGSPMHDGVAVASVFLPKLISLIPVAAAIEPPSTAVEFNPPRKNEVTRCVVAEWLDTHGYEEILLQRVLEAVNLSCR